MGYTAAGSNPSWTNVVDPQLLPPQVLPLQLLAQVTPQLRVPQVRSQLSSPQVMPHFTMGSTRRSTSWSGLIARSLDSVSRSTPSTADRARFGSKTRAWKKAGSSRARREMRSSWSWFIDNLREMIGQGPGPNIPKPREQFGESAAMQP